MARSGRDDSWRTRRGRRGGGQCASENRQAGAGSGWRGIREGAGREGLVGTLLPGGDGGPRQ
jgi:hypothetical protein